MEESTRGGDTRGMALLAVLLILLIITGSSASFIWFMNQQQTRAGTRFRSAAAMAVAEAGVHRALSILESVAPDGTPGRFWRPAAHSEILPVATLEGRFTLSAADEAGGAIAITSAGEVGGVTRRLRARVYLASPALLVALYGTSLVRIERPPAAIAIVPYGSAIEDRPWVHIAAGRGIGFGATDVSINNPAVAMEPGPGPVLPPPGKDDASGLPIAGPVRLLLARAADLTIGPEHQRVDVQQLRVMGVRIEGVTLRTEALPRLPQPQRAFFQAQAAANTSNANVNESAGKYLGLEDLARKRDSVYSQEHFEQLQAFLDTGPQGPRGLQGWIYVRGGVSLSERQQLAIADGVLVTEDTLRLSNGATLEITHSAATRTLPGIIVLDNGGLIVAHKARLRAHGLVFVSRIVDVWEGARVDIVEALLGSDPVLSFRNLGARVLIRYDPAVLGTPGLRVPDDAPVVAWVAAWEELP